MTRKLSCAWIEEGLGAKERCLGKPELFPDGGAGKVLMSHEHLPGILSVAQGSSVT